MLAHIYQQAFDEYVEAEVYPLDMYGTMTCWECEGKGEFILIKDHPIYPDMSWTCVVCRGRGYVWVSLY